MVLYVDWLGEERRRWRRFYEKGLLRIVGLEDMVMWGREDEGNDGEEVMEQGGE